jgi:hypothetical protein
MVQLKLVKVSLKVLSKEEKRNILVPGPKLEKIIPKSVECVPETPIMNLPSKLPMNVKPKLYK